MPGPISHLDHLLSTDLDFHDQPSNYASHNFHSFPAKFPPQLPRIFIEGLTAAGDIVLDPMVGSGTTLLEARLAGRRGLGFDIDPLALRISQVKVTPLNSVSLFPILQQIISAASFRLSSSRAELERELNGFFLPATRKFVDDWFLPETQLELLALLTEIRKIPNKEIQTFFEVAFSSIIITKAGGVSLALDLGHTRPHRPKLIIKKSGASVPGQLFEKAPSYLTKTVRPAIPEFKKRVLQNIAGLSKPAVYPVEISYGNAQRLPLKDHSIDLVVTSPPYASNAIDYMRAHKFSLVWLGYSIEDLSKKRREYIGDEALIPLDGFVFPGITTRVLSDLEVVDHRKSLTLRRYYFEMAAVLKEMFRVLKPQCSSIVVVGNSMMRGIDTQTAVCLAEIGRALGFEVPRIEIRHLDRDKRMMPVGINLDLNSQIQQRMHEEYVIGFYKPS
jgi:DNA modification methylase